MDQNEHTLFLLCSLPFFFHAADMRCIALLSTDRQIELKYDYRINVSFVVVVVFIFVCSVFVEMRFLETLLNRRGGGKLKLITRFLFYDMLSKHKEHNNYTI
jgi:hypothetical protein